MLANGSIDLGDPGAADGSLLHAPIPVGELLSSASFAEGNTEHFL